MTEQAYKPSDAELVNLFTYHPVVNADQATNYEKIRAGALAFAWLISKTLPDCPEVAEAVRHVRLAMMIANGGTACRTPTE